MRVGEKGYTPCKRAVREMRLAPEASVNLKKWIPWDAFLALPPTLQRLYAQTQVDKYRVGVGILAMAWGKADGTVRAVFAGLGIRLPPGTRKSDKQRFMEFVKGVGAETVGSPSSVAVRRHLPPREG